MPRENVLPHWTLNDSILDKYMHLPIANEKILATYVWIDGTEENFRCKTRVIDIVPKNVNELPIWTYDGASTYQEHESINDIYLHPVAIYKDPFLQGNNILVLSDTYYKFDDLPTPSNKRKSCLKVVEKCIKAETWFGFEQLQVYEGSAFPAKIEVIVRHIQRSYISVAFEVTDQCDFLVTTIEEYSLFDRDERPLGWPKNGFPNPQGPYYCAVGANHVFGRAVGQAHLRACLFAGIKMSGINAEIMPSQWEYQIGPCPGMTVADDLTMSRFILHRICEEFGIVANLKPKPMTKTGYHWHGSGCHTNVSTNVMREPGGIKEIEKAITKLSKCHDKHLAVYDPQQGKDNALRLLGFLYTGSTLDFTSGIDNRNVSVRIPRMVYEAGAGFFEDRRPSSNCDPYAVVEAILRTICLDE